jgi:ATP-dependent RNA helicase SUPV3L1/SUV3
VLDKRPVDPELKALSQAERRTLKALGVRIGAFSLFLPAVIRPEAIACARALTRRLARRSDHAGAPAQARAGRARAGGQRPARRRQGFTVPVEVLERLDALLRAEQKPGGVVLTEAALQSLGWTAAQGSAVLRALDYTPAIRPKSNAPIIWKRRGAAKRPEVKVAPRPDSPFAALAKLTEPPPRRKKPRRRKAAAESRVVSDGG